MAKLNSEFKILSLKQPWVGMKLSFVHLADAEDFNSKHRYEYLSIWDLGALIKENLRAWL